MQRIKTLVWQPLAWICAVLLCTSCNSYLSSHSPRSSGVLHEVQKNDNSSFTPFILSAAVPPLLSESDTPLLNCTDYWPSGDIYRFRGKPKDGMSELLEMLIGLPEDRAAEIVIPHGKTFRAVHKDEFITADHRTDRITVVVEDGIVLKAGNY